MKNVCILALLSAIFLTGCNSGGGGGSAPEDKLIAFVTNNPSDYWLTARAGTEKAAKELKGFKVQFVMLDKGEAAVQKAKMDDLIVNGAKGIAVSPVAPKDQTLDLNADAAKTLLITQDSDAPDSNRACYIGTDNEKAGEMLGGAVLKALPNGGKIMVFVGDAGAQNAKDRYEGLKKALEGSKVSIIDLRTDNTERARAKQNVADAIVKYPDLAGCVGLWSYNGPAIADAVKEAKKVGKIQIICFDTDPGTPEGVADGTIFATEVQQPFEFGYQSMKLMAAVLSGDKTAIPASKQIIIPTQLLYKDTIKDYMDNLHKLTGK